MAPIRIGMIGLSASAKTSWAAQGHLPYLLSERGRERYEITALLNSSEAAGKAARKHFNLPSTVKVYASPEELANDPDIDLVVCNTRVDVHASVTQASVAAGKSVFIEWPLTQSVESAEELLARYPSAEAGRRSIIGLQCRLTPPVVKVKELLASGAIGKVLSSDIRAFANLLKPDAYPEGLAYFAERAVGGSPLTIIFIHMLDFVHDTIGEWAGGPGGFTSHAQIQRPEIAVYDASGKTVRTMTADMPDLVTIAGALAPNTTADPRIKTAAGATLTVSFRNGPSFPGTSNFQWTINGEKGEIRMTSPAGPYLTGDSYGEPITIELHDYSTNKVSNIEWEWNEWQQTLPVRGRALAMLYDRYAEASKHGWFEAERKAGNGGNGRLPPDIEWPNVFQALDRLREVDALLGKWDDQQQQEQKGQ